MVSCGLFFDHGSLRETVSRADCQHGKHGRLDKDYPHAAHQTHRGLLQPSSAKIHITKAVGAFLLHR